MIAHAMIGFGRTNRLKCIKRHMATVSIPYCISQYAFMERMCVMQSYLQLINHYFPTNTALKLEDFKDACVQAQPVKFKVDFTMSRLLIDQCAIKDLILEYLDEIQCLETGANQSYDRPRYNDRQVE